MYSSATSCHSESPGSLFWMCHHSISTGSPEPAAAEVAGAVPGSDPAAVEAGGDVVPDGAVPAASSSSSPPQGAATRAKAPTTRPRRAVRASNADLADLRRMVDPPFERARAVRRRSVPQSERSCQTLSIPLSTPFDEPDYAHPVPTRRVTIGDVAAEAGVSIATVSKVINDRYGVAPDTLTKVKAVIAELGYESSLVARSMRSRRTNVIGILVADIEAFRAELLKGAATAIRDTDYELIVYSGSGHRKEHSGWERRNVSRLSGTLTDGIILVTPTVVDVSDAAPIVTVDPHKGPPSLPSVHSDNLAGAITATEYLIGLGHRRIGFLAGRPDLESARLREQGFRGAMAAAGIPVDPRLIRVGEYAPETTEEPARELLTLDEPPTAIFAANDLSAIATMHVAHSLEVSIPD